MTRKRKEPSDMQQREEEEFRAIILDAGHATTSPKKYRFRVRNS